MERLDKRLAGTGGQQPVGQRPVVGEQQQPLGVLIQPPGGKQSGGR